MDTTLFIAQKGRTHIVEDAGEIDRVITEIKSQGGEISEYEFYEKHTPVYYAIRSSDGKYSPLHFPEPRDYGLTAPQLYAMAVTYRDCIKRGMEKIIKKKPSTAAEIKKIMVLGLPIVIIAFLIFIMVVAMGG